MINIFRLRREPTVSVQRERAEGEGLAAKWQSHCRRQP